MRCSVLQALALAVTSLSVFAPVSATTNGPSQWLSQVRNPCRQPLRRRWFTVSLFSPGISHGLRLGRRFLCPSRCNARRFKSHGREGPLRGSFFVVPLCCVFRSSWPSSISPDPFAPYYLQVYTSYVLVVRCVFFFFHDTCVFSNYIFPFILPAGPDPSIVSGYHTMASF